MLPIPTLINGQGSYSPSTEDKPTYEKTCKYHLPLFVARDTDLASVEPETAPSGMIARGHYNATSKFVDDDNETHLKFEWSFDIKKDW